MFTTDRRARLTVVHGVTNSPWGYKELDTAEQVSTHAHTYLLLGSG